MSKYLNFGVNQIHQHPSMVRKDGTKYCLSTIKLWYNRINLDQPLMIPKTGRPKILTLTRQDDLINLVRNNPKKRYNEIRKMYLNKYKINIKRRTINNYLLRNGYKTFKSIKRPTLTPAHIKQRKELSNKYQIIAKRKKNLIFTDEKKFLLSSENNKVQFVNRKIGSDPFEHQYMHYGNQLSSVADLNVWAYIGPFGKGSFAFFLF